MMPPPLHEDTGPRSRLHEAARLAALYQSHLLDTEPEEPFDRVTRLVSRVLQVPVSLVTLVDRDRQFFKSIHGPAEPWQSQRETPLSHSICQYVVEDARPLVINDTTQHERLRDHLAVRDLDVQAYLGVPLRTPDGHVLGSLCAIDLQAHAWTEEDQHALQDLAQVVETELSLRAQMAYRDERHTQLVEASGARERFFVAMGREILTPLDGLMGATAILQGMRLNNEQRDLVGIVEISAETMHTLAQDMMHAGDLEAGAVSIRHDPFRPARLVADVVSLFQPMVAGCPISLEAEVDPVVPPVLYGDEARIRQILTTLVGRAAKSVRRGSIIVRVTVEGLATEAPCLRMAVQDTGPGLTEQQQQQLLQPFETDKPRPSGLGLSVSRRLAERMGGRLLLESTIGEGTTLSCTVQIALAPPEPAS
ncbi:MAG: GAF domain-containing protein [Bacteroidota bacterium]